MGNSQTCGRFSRTYDDDDHDDDDDNETYFG